MEVRVKLRAGAEVRSRSRDRIRVWVGVLLPAYSPSGSDPLAAPSPALSHVFSPTSWMRLKGPRRLAL